MGHGWGVGAGSGTPQCSPSPCPQVVLTEEQTLEDGERVAHQLMKELGIEESDLISGAYLDLLLAKGESGSGGLAGVPTPGAEPLPCHPSPGL